MPRRKAITVKAVTVEDKPPWDREKLKKRLKIPESTLGRYLNEVVEKHIPEFDYVPNQREFDDFQIFTVNWLRDLYSRGPRTSDILKRLEKGELLDDYQKSLKSRIEIPNCYSDQRTA